MSRTAMESARRWDRFWFSPRMPQQLDLVRLFGGLVAAILFMNYLATANEWIGPHGWLNAETTRYLIGDGIEGTGSGYRWSLLYGSPGFATLLAVVGVIASVLLASGIGSRVSPVVAWLTLAMFHHRTPMLVGLSEPLVASLLVYLAIDPGRIEWKWTPGLTEERERISANIALRLVQCHFGIWMAFSWMSMLSFPSWWNGEAGWELLNQRFGTPKVTDSYQWVGQFLTHLVIGLQLGILASLFSSHWRWLGRWMAYVFVASMLLLTADAMYAAVLLVFTLAVWPVSFTFGKVTHDPQA
jgi:hypothetical protein